MYLFLVGKNGDRIDNRCWNLIDAHIALEALAVCGIEAHLEVRSNVNDVFVDKQIKWNR